MDRDNKSEWCPSLRFTTLGKDGRVNSSSTATSTKSTRPTTPKLAAGAAPFCNDTRNETHKQISLFSFLLFHFWKKKKKHRKEMENLNCTTQWHCENRQITQALSIFPLLFSNSGTFFKFRMTNLPHPSPTSITSFISPLPSFPVSLHESRRFISPSHFDLFFN
jgi:hypothetical protein